MIAPSRTLQLAWGSLGVSFVVLAMKAGAYWLTGSVALYSDALETVINVVAAIGALIALWFSEQPADANHPYGHHKAEYLSAVVEGALVLATAFAIAHEAWRGWQTPHPPETPFLGIALNGAAGLINLVWALVLIRNGRRWKSPALIAGGKHIMTDVWTTGAVLIGFALVPLTGWLRLDPAVAALVAVNILWAGYAMLRESVGGLMDEVSDPAAVSRLRQIISENAEGAIEAHDVRTRTAGSVTFVEFHLVVPGRMAVEDSHAICDQIESALRHELGDAVINIHVEPELKAKHTGVPVL
ncbi:cation diffusion facilitator family transporter [Acidisphaera sp. L21]|uniref:cation diffusion facilitator family transporter n=1 Tax=Acidisphaera sp. L21 TaxID=1641851 RepID=UPI00131AE416|nr:cation diffusion facilitator family transporter [Acidisphaera sp. L21]